MRSKRAPRPYIIAVPCGSYKPRSVFMRELRSHGGRVLQVQISSPEAMLTEKQGVRVEQHNGFSPNPAGDFQNKTVSLRGVRLHRHKKATLTLLWIFVKKGVAHGYKGGDCMTRVPPRFRLTASVHHLVIAVEVLI